MSDMTAAVLGSLASPDALTMVAELLERHEGATVTELEKATGLPQPTVTRTLQALARAGLLNRDRPTKAYTVASPEAVRRLLDEASALALAVLKARTGDAESLQRRVRKSRLSTAPGSRPTRKSRSRSDGFNSK